MNSTGRGLHRWYERLTAPLHAWPDFIIVGAQRAGSTSLHACLMQHPQIVSAAGKELHFFDLNYGRGASWYRLQFPRRCRLAGNRITGEATPYYLFHPRVPGRIHRLLPGVKLIALLRNPVDRAVSHFLHETRRKRETLPFDQALRVEAARLEPELRMMEADEFYHSEAHHRFAYQARGLYAEQLERYFRFFPRDQILALCSEEFFADPGRTLKDVFAFLGVADFVPPDLAPRNVGNTTQNIPAEAREALRAYFVPHNERLFRLLGRRFDW